MSSFFYFSFYSDPLRWKGNYYFTPSCCFSYFNFIFLFYNSSFNIRRLEKCLGNYGVVFKCANMGQLCVNNTCEICKKVWASDNVSTGCPSCYSQKIKKGYLADVAYHRKFAVHIPRPSMKVQNKAKDYLKPNSVGIFDFDFPYLYSNAAICSFLTSNLSISCLVCVLQK